MKHSFFSIKNFKGIEFARIDFDAQPRSNVYTLVGLNESGKTTVLEALNLLTYKSESLDPLNLPGYSVKDVHELIPISKRSNFNDAIEITSGFTLDADDNKSLRQFLTKEHKFTLTRTIEKCEITQKYSFKDSKLITPSPKSTWSIQFWGKTQRGRKIRKLTGPDWLAAVNHLKAFIPTVLFFPNFLFEFPDRIYLDDVPIDAEKHKFYRVVLQDILDAIDKNLKLDKHVHERMISADRNDIRSLESVLLEMGGHITQTVFGSWNRIFNRKIGKKEIVVDYDKDEAGKWYLQLSVKDGTQLYTISERSLGFRWFFVFLLFTLYRGYRQDGNKSTLYLFDEPASNLHPSAQSQLLESFRNFPDNSSIVYTTHSHHMINPSWLEGAYVVMNEGLDYGDEDNFSAKHTKVTLTKYRKFVVDHPSQRTYFQPVLDVLNYAPGKLENVPNVVILEGKNDFYTLYYIQKNILSTAEINLLPGSGSGSLDDVIRLYIAWGRQFIVLLDADEEGEKQKKRYESIFGINVHNRIFTLKDVNSDWDCEMEHLFDPDERLEIQRASYPGSSTFNKTHFNRSIQELTLTNSSVGVSEETRQRFETLIEFCSVRLVS